MSVSGAAAQRFFRLVIMLCLLELLVVSALGGSDISHFFRGSVARRSHASGLKRACRHVRALNLASSMYCGLCGVGSLSSFVLCRLCCSSSI